MPFKIKDLMIHVLDPKAPAPRPCPGPSICTIPSLCRPLTHCLPITFCETLPTHICTAIYSLCGPNSCGPTFCAIPTHCASPSICPLAVSQCNLVPSQCGVAGSQCGATVSFCAIPSNCGFLSPCGAATPCGALPSLCGPCSAGTIFDPTIQEVDPAAGLAALKEQLKQVAKNVEAQEAAVNDALLPQTVAEAEDLEKRLTAALDEVKARKAQLQKSSRK